MCVHVYCNALLGLGDIRYLLCMYIDSEYIDELGTCSPSLVPPPTALRHVSSTRSQHSQPTSASNFPLAVALHTLTATMDTFDVSNFDPNAILRGAQLTLVGGRLAISIEYCPAMAC